MTTTAPTYITATNPNSGYIETYKLVDGSTGDLVAVYKSGSGHRIELHLDP